MDVQSKEHADVAYLTVSRLWRDIQVPLLRVSLARAQAEARFAALAGLRAAQFGCGSRQEKPLMG